MNAGRKYRRMLQGEHSAILLTFIKRLFVIKVFVLSIFEWLFYTGFTVFKCTKNKFCTKALFIRSTIPKMSLESNPTPKRAICPMTTQMLLNLPRLSNQKMFTQKPLDGYHILVNILIGLIKQHKPRSASYQRSRLIRVYDVCSLSTKF